MTDLMTRSARLDESSGLSVEGDQVETCALTAAAAATQSSTPSSTCEAMLWEGWASQLPNSTVAGDDASMALAQLPELASSSSSSSSLSCSRLSCFHQQSDMLATMLAHFHPLANHAVIDQSAASTLLFQDQSSAESEAAMNPIFTGITKSCTPHLLIGTVPCPMPLSKWDDHTSHFELHSKPNFGMITLPPTLHMDWPDSPSSPQALQHNANVANCLEHHGPWHDDVMAHHGSPHDSSTLLSNDRGKKLELFPVTHQLHADVQPTSRLFPSDSAEIHLQNENLAAVWSTDSTASVTSDAVRLLVDQTEANNRPSPRSQQLMHFVRVAQEQRAEECKFYPDDYAIPAPCTTGFGKYTSQTKSRTGKHHRPEPVDSTSGPPPKRPYVQAVDHEAGLWRPAGRSSASQSMEIFAIGPALNTNGKPRARRGSATDPQSVYARHRREKINERLKILQHLVPNGAKVDIVTMLDEAVHYVQFLQLQVKLLKSDKYWIHATPNTYKGIDLSTSFPPTQTQGLGSRP